MSKLIPLNYELIAGAFTACSIAQQIKMLLPPETPVIAAWEMFMERNPDKDWCCLVRDDKQIYGYLRWDDPIFEHPLEGSVNEGVSQIKPETIVPASLPLLELVPLFEISDFFFVLTRNEITHIVSFSDLDKLPFKFSLFSLCMELESLLIELLAIDHSKLRDYLNLLSENRLTEAKRLCALKYKEETPRRVLLCTNFVDKKEMLMKSSDFKDELPFQSKADAHRFFYKVNHVRNQIAHSDSILPVLGVPCELRRFIDDLSNLIKTIADMKIKRLP